MATSVDISDSAVTRNRGANSNHQVPLNQGYLKDTFFFSNQNLFLQIILFSSTRKDATANIEDDDVGGLIIYGKNKLSLPLNTVILPVYHIFSSPSPIYSPHDPTSNVAECKIKINSLIPNISYTVIFMKM
jgi:hypothetical protein